MDDKWFKQQQKKVGVTAKDIADEMGRSRTIISHIYTGRQRMSLEWAKVFAKVLDAPLDEVLRRAGSLTDKDTKELVPGFSEGDVTPFEIKDDRDQPAQEIARSLGGGRPGVDVWSVKSDALVLAGYLPGDALLVDTHQADRVRAGDTVIAQVYDAKNGTASTVLRKYQPPALISASASNIDQSVKIVDGVNVLIRGKVIASWRA